MVHTFEINIHKIIKIKIETHSLCVPKTHKHTCYCCCCCSIIYIKMRTHTHRGYTIVWVRLAVFTCIEHWTHSSDLTFMIWTIHVSKNHFINLFNWPVLVCFLISNKIESNSSISKSNVGMCVCVCGVKCELFTEFYYSNLCAIFFLSLYFRNRCNKHDC